MSLTRILRSLPLRKHLVVKLLLLATLLFIVYQLTFVAELDESTKSKHLKGHIHSEAKKFHPKDLKMLAELAKKGSLDKSKNMEVRLGESANMKESVSEKVERHLKLKEQNKKIKKSIASNIESRVNPKEENVLSVDKETPIIPQIAENKSVFTCRASGKVITADKVNDDYCDCPLDGSDEPRTNACTNTKFSCLKTKPGSRELIPSAWVNDGICDCCDGSDEWQSKPMYIFLPLQLQNKIGRFMSPCPNQCP